jgi:hypothetical protein
MKTSLASLGISLMLVGCGQSDSGSQSSETAQVKIPFAYVVRILRDANRKNPKVVASEASFNAKNLEIAENNCSEWVDFSGRRSCFVTDERKNSQILEMLNKGNVMYYDFDMSPKVRDGKTYNTNDQRLSELSDCHSWRAKGANRACVHWAF